MPAMALSSHAGDGAVKAALVVARCCCRVMLVTMLSSHIGDDATEATWSRRDVAAESC
jgi:hypothetical protein